jgi:hypothetical protein
MFATLTKVLLIGLVVLSTSFTAAANDIDSQPKITKIPQMWHVVKGVWTVSNQKPQMKHQVFFAIKNFNAASKVETQAQLIRMPFITVELQSSEDE